MNEEQERGPAEAHGSERDAQEQPFEDWWEREGQFCRAGGGQYEKTFAWNAWCAALAAKAPAVAHQPLTEELLHAQMDSKRYWPKPSAVRWAYIAGARFAEKFHGINGETNE